jgi:hypothetical protein
MTFSIGILDLKFECLDRFDLKLFDRKFFDRNQLDPKRLEPNQLDPKSNLTSSSCFATYLNNEDNHYTMSYDVRHG